MTNYAAIIEAKYPGAKNLANFEVTHGPILQPATFDDEGNFIVPDNSNAPWEHKITKWDLPDPQPTLKELEEWSATQEYLTISLAKAKEAAIAEVNLLDAAASEKSGTITATISMSLRYTHNAMLVKQWRDEGRPENPDKFIYAAAYAEGEKFIPPYIAAKMLEVWEQAWTQMSNEPGRALRRWALEAIKDAQTVEAVNSVLEVYKTLVEQQLKEIKGTNG